MKKILPYFLAILVSSCFTLKQNGEELLQNNKDLEIAEILTINNNDSLYFNELRILLPSALYTQKYMFKKFGHWDKVLKINDYENYLIWKNCKLFDEKSESYTVAASGSESKQTYSCVIVINKDNTDLLAENSKLRDALVSMFYYGTKRTSLSKDKFYRKYWKMRNSIK
ncbi:hypothetical protein [Tamlana crocina]|uniref:Lipoprotein n=1 Tax=Tamlana crocina TaxID=393006 RepID=A0ABX1DG05_9FLAO|nr:hypothetical protein [Tamlana crocina]NJX16191.1 hypothetical protein [Tamlana crocina]